MKYSIDSLGNKKYRLIMQAYLRAIAEIVENSKDLGQQEFAQKIWDENTKDSAYKIWKDVRRVNQQTRKPLRMIGAEEAMKMADVLGENFEYLIVVARANLALGKYQDLLNLFFDQD